jgi:hypothetical protein
MRGITERQPRQAALVATNLLRFILTGQFWFDFTGFMIFDFKFFAGFGFYLNST